MCAAVMEIDALGTFNMSRAAFPALRESGDAAVVNISATLHYGATWYQVRLQWQQRNISYLLRLCIWKVCFVTLFVPPASVFLGCHVSAGSQLESQDVLHHYAAQADAVTACKSPRMPLITSKLVAYPRCGRPAGPCLGSESGSGLPDADTRAGVGPVRSPCQRHRSGTHRRDSRREASPLAGWMSEIS